MGIQLEPGQLYRTASPGEGRPSALVIDVDDTAVTAVFSSATHGGTLDRFDPDWLRHYLETEDFHLVGFVPLAHIGAVIARSTGASMMDAYRVADVASVEDFLARYYRPERYTGRGEQYATGLLASYRRELNERGHVFISRHDSVTARVVSYFVD